MLALQIALPAPKWCQALTVSLIEVDVNSLKLQWCAPIVVSSDVNPMFITYHLPELKMETGSTHLQRFTLSSGQCAQHQICCAHAWLHSENFAWNGGCFAIYSLDQSGDPLLPPPQINSRQQFRMWLSYYPCTNRWRPSILSLYGKGLILV